MNNLKSYVLAIIGILSLVATLTLNVARANNAEAPTTMTSSTGHFTRSRTYLLNPTNGTGEIKCKVVEVDGDWLRCEDEGSSSEWVNTNALMSAKDSK